MLYTLGMEPFDPTPKPKRQSNQMNVRINESGRQWIKTKADTLDVTQTEIIKAALAFAAGRDADFTKTIERRKG